MSDDDSNLLLNDINNNVNSEEEQDLARLLDDVDNNNNNDNNNNDNNNDDGSNDDDDDDDDDSSSEGNNEDAAEVGKENVQPQENDNNNDGEALNSGNGEDAALASMSKKEAKNSLSKKDYKKWKKVQKKLKKKNKKDKKSKKGSSKKEASSGNKKKSSDEKTSTQKRKSKKHQKGSGGNDDDDDDDGGEDAALQEQVGSNFTTQRMPRGAGKKQSTAAAAAAKGKGKSLIPEETLRDEAMQVVMSMTDARRKDEAARKAGQPPLHRLGIKDLVVTATRKVLLHEHLVNAGLLDELTNWLADPKTKDLAPVDLRLVALHVLDNLAYEGIQGGMRTTSKRDKPKIDKATGERIDIDDLGYPGVSAENLQATKIGWAVNFVRRHPQESAENRTIATRLLEKFSRVFRGGDEEDRREASTRQKVLWSSQSDNTILPPFEVQPSVTQRYIEASTEADPSDPLSYLGVRRAYNKPSYVTGLGGASAARGLAGPQDFEDGDGKIVANGARSRNGGVKKKVESKVNKKKNEKASMESDDDGSLLDSGDDYDDDDEGFLA